MVATDREGDGLGNEPGAPELGPKEELLVLKPFLAHKTEPIERPQEREDVREPYPSSYSGWLVFTEKGPDAVVVVLRGIDVLQNSFVAFLQSVQAHRRDDVRRAVHVVSR